MHSLPFFVILVVLGLAWTEPDKGYCKLCDNHTMCIYKGRNTQTCNANVRPAITAAQKTLIVNKHNALRKQVAQGLEKQGWKGPQPATSNMKDMVWNEELAKIAQRWADQCTKGHDKCRNTKTYAYVGQNFASSGAQKDGTSPQFEANIQSWYDEVVNFDPANINPFKSVPGKGGKETGHYTQVVWGASTQVGCGYSSNYDGTWYWTNFLCNYGPGGNVVGTAMY